MSENKIAKINVIGHQKFIGREIPIIEGGFGEGKRCLTDKVIAEIHNQPVGEIRRRINDNIKRFKKDIDFIDIKANGYEPLGKNLDFTKQHFNQSKNIYLLSERGYAKLIKIMDTDLAWGIHDELIDRYFTMRQEIRETKESKSNLTREEELSLKILSGKATAIELKEYKELVKVKALAGENAIMTLGQVVTVLKNNIPKLTTTIFHEWLEYKGLGEYKVPKGERKRVFYPNESYMQFVANEGHALTRLTRNKDKIYVQYTSFMVSRIMNNHMSSLIQFTNMRVN